jgi:hypothetical protein
MIYTQSRDHELESNSSTNAFSMLDYKEKDDNITLSSQFDQNFPIGSIVYEEDLLKNFDINFKNWFWVFINTVQSSVFMKDTQKDIGYQKIIDVGGRQFHMHGSKIKQDNPSEDAKLGEF